jgi:regulator of sigma E protease
MGVIAVLWFGAMISLNLGVMNLLPIPVLDGGHLFFYAIEAIRGKAISHKTQQIGFRFGLSLVLALMVFTTFNDVRQIVEGL